MVRGGIRVGKENKARGQSNMATQGLLTSPPPRHTEFTATYGTTVSSEKAALKKLLTLANEKRAIYR